MSIAFSKNIAPSPWPGFYIYFLGMDVLLMVHPFFFINK